MSDSPDLTCSFCEDPVSLDGAEACIGCGKPMHKMCHIKYDGICLSCGEMITVKLPNKGDK